MAAAGGLAAVATINMEGKLGLSLGPAEDATGNVLRVMRVEPGGLAEVAAGAGQLYPGLIVRAVGGALTSGMEPPAVLKLIKLAGRPLTLALGLQAADASAALAEQRAAATHAAWHAATSLRLDELQELSSRWDRLGPSVQLVLRALCVVLEEAPVVEMEADGVDWNCIAERLIGGSPERILAFQARLVNYDLERQRPEVMSVLESAILSRSDFCATEVKKACTALPALVEWIVAVHAYHKLGPPTQTTNAAAALRIAELPSAVQLQIAALATMANPSDVAVDFEPAIQSSFCRYAPITAVLSDPTQCFTVVDGFVSSGLALELRSMGNRLDASGELRPAGVGTGPTRRQDSGVRGDRISWLSSEAEAEKFPLSIVRQPHRLHYFVFCICTCTALIVGLCWCGCCVARCVAAARTVRGPERVPRQHCPTLGADERRLQQMHAGVLPSRQPLRAA